ncbi:MULTISPECIES: SpoIVB peptidase [Acutalibacteraceae]|uniref:SpoIVB peptidase n=1 Tax=Acutalibacteraceae TaxID=3082771 RepID=UPI001FA9E327|nr:MULTISPECIES: SpoIVB peptidase [Acutalibacteraceae]
MKKIISMLTASAAMLELLLAVVLLTADYFTPDSYTVTTGNHLEWLSGAITVVGDSDVTASAGVSYPKTYQGTLMLYHLIPIKSVDVSIVDQTCVVPCGTPFGIKMFTDGVVIVGLADIQTSSGSVNPAAQAGLKIGDVITEVDGKEVSSNSEVAKDVENCDGKNMRFCVRRDGTLSTVTLQPVRAEADGLYKAGLWVRDSTAGIGTLTYYDPSTKSFAGLGHGICDSDTGELMPLLSGDIVPVTINGVSKGLKGKPGELRGYFTDSDAMGRLVANVTTGVYGYLNSAPEGGALKVAMKQDVKAGAVQILTTIDGGTPQYYDAEIERIDYRDQVQSKNLILHITDGKLITQTGGIVQGMSGSPILQGGKLVGAVTHVFVNDPTRGYGVFAENMLAESKSVDSAMKSKAS